MASHVDCFGSPVSRCSARYATFTFDKLEIVVSNVSGVVVGDMNKDSQNLPAPSINKTIESDPEILEFVVAIGRPNEVRARGVEHATLQNPF